MAHQVEAVAWSFCKAISSEIRIYPWGLTGLWEPGPHIGLPHPALTQGEKLCPAS